ncbi:MAG: hydroxymethylbilane synthase [Magnetococcales bacterium]|nr:hydroxymethylbilane synthase [Magnetococcales bacterium]
MMDFQKLRIGTRGSALALWQANWVKSKLEAEHADLDIELIIIKTKGDIILDVPLAKVGGKGLFVKELEEALLDGRADFAVHSMKDVPSEFPHGLELGPVLERADPRDVLLSINHKSLADLPHGAKVGSSSLRRQSQILAIRSDLKIIPLRGNVNTRIAKLVNGEFDAIILAAAGVERLEMTDHVVEYLDPEVVIPANGQGAVGIELRVGDAKTAKLLKVLNHETTRMCIDAERAFLATLEGGCQVPIAGFAQRDGDKLTMQGRVATIDGKHSITETHVGEAASPVALGVGLAKNLLAQGADKILAELNAAAANS